MKITSKLWNIMLILKFTFTPTDPWVKFWTLWTHFLFFTSWGNYCSGLIHRKPNIKGEDEGGRGWDTPWYWLLIPALNSQIQQLGEYSVYPPPFFSIFSKTKPKPKLDWGNGKLKCLLPKQGDLRLPACKARHSWWSVTPGKLVAAVNSLHFDGLSPACSNLFSSSRSRTISPGERNSQDRYEPQYYTVIAPPSFQEQLIRNKGSDKG